MFQGVTDIAATATSSHKASDVAVVKKFLPN